MSGPRKVDNGSPRLKAEIRRRLLAELDEPRVCDLFCGGGEMYRRAYQGVAVEYVGVDAEKVHDPELCLRMDNRRYIAGHDLTRFNVFDLDAYGSPWALFCRVLELAGPGPLRVFVTDGTPERLRLTNHAGGTKVMSATNGIPRGMDIPCQIRFYVPMVKTLLLYAGERAGWRITGGLRAFGVLQHVCYFGLRLERM